MLIVVNPGMVLTSLTNSPPCRVTGESRHGPFQNHSTALNASIDSRRISAVSTVAERRRDEGLRVVVDVLRFVVVELARRDDFARKRRFGSSFPSTAHSISLAFGTAASMTTFRSNWSASSIAALKSASDFAFEIPTLEPRLAGLTNTGYRNSSRTRCLMPAGSRSHS